MLHCEPREDRLEMHMHDDRLPSWRWECCSVGKKTQLGGELWGYLSRTSLEESASPLITRSPMARPLAEVDP